MLGVFFRHEFLELRLDAPGRDVLAVRCRKSRGKEELEWEHTAGSLHELLIGDSADGGLVHVDDLSDLAEGEGLPVLNSLLEELALPLDDVVHHLEHRLTTLLDRLDHPVGGIEL